jgi:hypothetical protein
MESFFDKKYDSRADDDDVPDDDDDDDDDPEKARESDRAEVCLSSGKDFSFPFSSLDRAVSRDFSGAKFFELGVKYRARRLTAARPTE